MPRREAACLALVAAILSASPLAANAQTAVSFSPMQRAELIALIGARGEPVALYPQVLGALGLENTSPAQVFRQLAVADRGTGITRQARYQRREPPAGASAACASSANPVHPFQTSRRRLGVRPRHRGPHTPGGRQQKEDAHRRQRVQAEHPDPQRA